MENLQYRSSYKLLAIDSMGTKKKPPKRKKGDNSDEGERDTSTPAPERSQPGRAAKEVKVLLSRIPDQYRIAIVFSDRVFCSRTPAKG
jgi:hypothetical protein